METQKGEPMAKEMSLSPFRRFELQVARFLAEYFSLRQERRNP